MVLVLSQLTGNEVIDRQRAEEYCRYAGCKGKIPVSPYLCFQGIFCGEMQDILISRLAEKADEVWVFGPGQGEERRRKEEEVCQRYGAKAHYFSYPEIGREMLVCAMYAEELSERLEEM